MTRFWNRRKLDLERELRALRAHPRDEFVETLAAEVRSRQADRSRSGRLGLALGMSGLIVVVLASFGGIGYASSSASHAKKQPAAHTRKASPRKIRVVHVVYNASPSAAQALYGPNPTPQPNPPTTTPSTPSTPSKPSKPSGGTTGGTGGGTAGGGTAGGTSSSGGAAAGAEGSSASSNPSEPSSNLPFTGLALWVPLAVGLALIATGLVLRTRSRRNDSSARS